MSTYKIYVSIDINYQSVIQNETWILKTLLKAVHIHHILIFKQ